MELSPSYTARPHWTQLLESAWSRFAKFQLLNSLQWTQLLDALAVRPPVNAAQGIDLRAAGAFDLARLTQTLRIPLHDLVTAFCVLRAEEYLTDAASAHVRLCAACASVGFHATVFQFTGLSLCPVHRCALRESCPNCKRRIPYRLNGALATHPYGCPNCHLAFFRAQREPRVRKISLSAESLARLRPWHQYVGWAASLNNFGDRAGRDPHSGRFLSNQARAQHSSFVHRHAFVGDLQRHFSLPPPIPEFETIETPGIVTDGKPIRSLRKRLHSFAGRWSGFDPLWAAIYPIYCRARHSKLQTIHCEGLPRMVGPAAAMPMRSGGLYIGGKAAPARTAALIGWRMTWEGRLSRETLTRAGRRLPPFGLFEWLAFAPDRGNDLRQTEWRIAMLRRFIVDLERTWAAWCSIVATMETVGHYLISPRLLPTRAVWIASLPRTASVLLPQEQPTAVSNLLRDFP
jgi:hypothetical protein